MNAIKKKSRPKAPYGRCPECGAPGKMRERRLYGNDVCVNGHVYKSKDAVNDPLVAKQNKKPKKSHACGQIVNAVLLVFLFAANAAALDFSQSVAIVSCKVSARDSNQGSGCVFYVGPDRVLLSTAGHIPDGRDAAYIEFRPEGKTGHHYPADVLAQDRQADWAVLSVDTSRFIGWRPTPIRPIQDGQSVAVGSQVYFAGYAGDNPLRAGVGTLTGRMIGSWVECSNPFRSGESGGPVVAMIDGQPRLLGIIVIRSDTGGGFTPIDVVHRGYQETGLSFPRLPAGWERCQCSGPNCPTAPRYSPLRPGQRQQPQGDGDRLPSWIVPEVPDPDVIDPAPETPVYPSADPNMPDDIAEIIMPGGPKKPAAPAIDPAWLEAWKVEAVRAAKLEAENERLKEQLESANAAPILATPKPIKPVPDSILNPVPPPTSDEIEHDRLMDELKRSVDACKKLKAGDGGRPMTEDEPAELTLPQRIKRDISWLLLTLGVTSWGTWTVARWKKKGGAG